MAVKKKLLDYREKDGHDFLLTQGHQPEVSLALNRNGTKNNQSKAAKVEKSEEKCVKQGKAKINFDGSFVRAFPLCHEQKLDRKKSEVEWQSYRLIGETTLSAHNKFQTHLNTHHLTEQEIGLEIDIEKKVFDEKIHDYRVEKSKKMEEETKKAQQAKK
jgi:hypothetical protein